MKADARRDRPERPKRAATGSARSSKRATDRHEHPPRRLPCLPPEPQIRSAAAMFQALGDPERLRLMIRLSEQEICVSELAELAQEQLTTVSARLKSLYAARLVKRRRQAKHVFYSIADDHVLQMIRGAVAHAAEPNSPHAHAH
ncbi:ArsR/SmtB family transcription factor [Rhodopseudomonas palustris]|nr:metalloregulator ArsR/SmtB family transcription factor [Rhodopseudomonas palustris]